MDFNKLVVVSNRLPVRIESGDGGSPEIKPASGGLVTALNPVLKEMKGVWIGWPGSFIPEGLCDLMSRASEAAGYTISPVELSEDEIDAYYRGFANEILWPLCHDMVARCNFDPAYWPVYKQVNGKFAEQIIGHTGEDDYVWVHDYHLMYVAKKLRDMGVMRKLGFFLHIPFPPVDIFLKLPWRREILYALLQYDLLGFQTLRDKRNFVNCVRTLFPDVRVKGGGYFGTLKTPERDVRIGAFPISIDYQDFNKSASGEEVEREVENLRRMFPGKKLILGVDRLDYSKGIPHRIRAFGRALEKYPELRRNVTYLQVVVPSRINVAEYRKIKDEVDRLIGSVNGRFTETGWTPIQYIFNPVTRTQLLALYRESHIALVTPLKDGMNLVAKEYCACSIDDDGCLILSEFAGAASQLNNGALIVNPFDLESTAEAIYRGFTMDETERRERMQKMRRSIRRNDIFRWVDNFLKASTKIRIKDLNHIYDDQAEIYPQTHDRKDEDGEPLLPQRWKTVPGARPGGKHPVS